MSKLDFSAIPGHVEHESAPEATATSALDFSAIPGHVQHSDSVKPEATTLGKITKDVQSILRRDAEATEKTQTASAPWQPSSVRNS